MSLGTNAGWPYEPGQQGTSLNPNRRPTVPVSTPSTEPATPPPPPDVATSGELIAPRKVLAAVQADLAALGDLSGGARGSLAALALYLAEVIDTRGADAPPAASARLAQELRATLQSLMTTERDSDPDRLGQFLDEMGTPADLPAEVGDAADPGPADARPEGRRHRKGAR